MPDCPYLVSPVPNEKTNDAATGPEPDQAKEVLNLFGPVPDWNYECRNADDAVSLLDADARFNRLHPEKYVSFLFDDLIIFFNIRSSRIEWLIAFQMCEKLIGICRCITSVANNGYTQWWASYFFKVAALLYFCYW
jgi:hypothetical protein